MANISLRFREIDRDKFNKIVLGKKSIETRAATIKYKTVNIGDNLIIVCGKSKIKKEVKNIEHYKNVEEMLQKIDYIKVFPDAKSIKDVTKAYNSFPEYEEKIKTNGILAFYI